MDLIKPKHAGGRPKIKVDHRLLRKLAEFQATEVEAAAFFEMSPRTMIRRLKEPALRDVWEQGKANGRVSLRRLQWRHAKLPNSAGVQMTIHLSKHYLGQTDRSAIEMSGRVDSTVEVTSARERVNHKLSDLSERIRSRVAGIAVAAGAKPAPVEAE